MSSTARQLNAAPQDLDAERAVLGAILHDADALGSALDVFGVGAGPELFHSEAHQEIWSAMCSLDRESKPIDAITLKDKLATQGALESIGGVAYLSELSGSVPASANAAYYAEIVREHYKLRRLLDMGARIINTARDNHPSDDILGEIDQALHSLNTRSGGSEPLEISSVVSSVVERAENAVAGKPDPLTGILTGVPWLDRRLPDGLRPGDMVVVGARPSVGKTAFGCMITGKTATEEGNRVLFISCEMSREAIGERILYSVSGANKNKIRYQFQNIPEIVKLKKGQEKLKDAPILVSEMHGPTMSQIRSTALRHQARRGLDLIIIDYLQLIRGDGKQESKTIEVEELSRRCKALAGELGVPMILLSQLSRDNEHPDRPPTMARLRWSGAIEQDADIVILLHTSPGTVSPDGVAPLHVNIDKFRDGPIDQWNCVFHRNTQQIVEQASHRDDPPEADKSPHLSHQVEPQQEQITEEETDDEYIPF